MNKKEFNIHDTLLGKEAAIPEKYDASLLFRIPRSENRLHYGIIDANLPFVGFDVWNCYEVSFLTDNGLPVSRVLKIIYSSDSPFLVESKSLKLYLNAFNMERFGSTLLQATSKVQTIISSDLSALLQTDVKAILLSDKARTLEAFSDLSNSELTEQLPEEQLLNMKFSHFLESPSLLKGELTSEMHQVAFRTDLLRSNCRVTNQPDWGDLFVRISTPYMVDLSSVVAYLVSFRKENHFHEEVVEMIYKRLLDAFKPHELMVAAMYTRRGGIDINPIRAMHIQDIDAAFLSTEARLAKTLRQ